MDRNRKTLAFTVALFNAKDGPSYSVYTQAYGMEMSVADWPLNILIMAPPHLVSAMTDAADIQSAGMIPGASYTPGDGDYEQIRSYGGKWVLARPSDDVARIVAEGLGIVLTIEKASEMKVIADLEGIDSANLMIAYQINSISTVESAQKECSKIRKRLPTTCRESSILVSGSFEHADIVDYQFIDGVTGLLFLDASFEQVLPVIKNIIG
ncbi:hypothetical protein [Novipirellula sp.]|uniref:hypothetical protein n=1 Tax=Novipirellula sp. TaxID=2795430 RepID=UPI00356A8046